GEYVNERDGCGLVFVPGGSFDMGSNEGEERERPGHTVALAPFFVGKLELSWEPFAAFVAATGHVTDAELEGWGGVEEARGIEYRPGAHWRDPLGRHELPAPRQPVLQVSWHDASAYAAWAGLALPTEAQWEKAAGWDARARRARRYAWGDEPASAASRAVGNVADESFRRAG